MNLNLLKVLTHLC